MSMRGHNETPVRLGMLAEDAKRALIQIEQGEAGAIDGWLAYGVALNEGRSLFAGDTEFGRWVAENSLRQLGGADVHDHERTAAMWAAGNLDQFEEARAAGKSRTVRGAHEKWKLIEAEREQARQAEARKAEREAAAEAARQQAEEHAKAEEAAREAARVAVSDEEKQAAETLAEEAAAAKDEALMAAEASSEESSDDDAAAAFVDPVEAPIREEWRRLSDIAREDGFVQARLLLADKEAELREATERAERLETWWNTSVQGDNLGRALGAAKAQVDALSGRVNEHLGTIKRIERRLKLAEAERDRLRADVENQMIPL